MQNKIEILNDSALLYEHYINDDKWERTLAFPRGGLTYLISNGTIKFYAYEDYFYRNCIISMQLPIYIVDEFMHIDGEFDDLEEIVDILDRIFPTNDIDAQLEKYLMKVDADLLYQPIGDYALKSDIPDVSEFVTTDELVDALEDYYTKDEVDTLLDDKADKDDVYTKDEADARFQPIGEYLTSADTYVKSEIDDKLDDKLDASAYTPCDLSNYYTKQETSSKTQIDIALNGKADNDKVYTKNESDAKYQIKLVAGDNITISGNVISASGGGGEPVDAYTKAESDARYQPKGNYATESWVLNKNYITSASTVFNNYYTTANTYNKTEINQFITNIQNQISALTEALNECCSGTPTPTVEYRWVEMTGASDFVCSGYDKYAKEKKQQSTDGGTTWTDVTPLEYRQGSRLIESDSTDCGYDTPIKFSGTSRSVVTPQLSVNCNSSLVISSGETHAMTDWKTLYIGGCCDTIGEHAFMSNYITNIVIPSNIKRIKLGAFSNSRSATSVSFAEGLESIGQQAFTALFNTQNIVIPNSVTSIGGQAFYTNRFRTVTIGSGITSIGNEAFTQDVSGGHDTMESVTINAVTPPTLDSTESTTFNGTYPIYVPAQSVETYKTAWTQYASRIRAINS